MNPGISVWRCQDCQNSYFPQPLLCPNCHGSVFRADRVFKAVVEEVSMVRHMLGQADWQPRRIASVRLAEGQRLTVGLLDNSPPGTVLHLFEQDGAPFAAERNSTTSRRGTS
jgi:uncharacterized OB-fold protein